MPTINSKQLAAFLFIAFWSSLVARAANTFSESEVRGIEAFLRTTFHERNSAIVVGLIDESGRRILADGSLNNGTDQKPDGDTVFFIGSVTKTFTALLLVEMAERGEVELDDPVAKFLPASVRVPTRNGKEITLLHLATHTGGFPGNANNMIGENTQQEYETYSVEMMHEYVSKFELTRDPGSGFEYSNVGMALLGHALERRAGMSFESLVIERICRPLGMDSTCIKPTGELKARLAMGRDR